LSAGFVFGRGCAAKVGATPDSRRSAFPRALRNDRGTTDSDARETFARGRNYIGGSREKDSSACRSRRLQHAGSGGARARIGNGRCRRPAFGYTLLQQADTGRCISALLRDRKSDEVADRVVQRARTLRNKSGTCDGEATRCNRKYRRHQGAIWEYFAGELG